MRDRLVDEEQRTEKMSQEKKKLVVSYLLVDHVHDNIATIFYGLEHVKTCPLLTSNLLILK